MASDLKDRLSLVFGSLNATLTSVAEPPLEDDPKDESTVRERRRDQRKRGHGSRDLYPDSKVPKPLKPDYVKHPQKWTEYDLTDDGTSQSEYGDLSDDQTNKKVALDLIFKLQKQATPTTSIPEGTTASGDKVVFKRPSIKRKCLAPIAPDSKSLKPMTDDSLPAAGGGGGGGGGYCGGRVLKMPEYFVGLTQKTIPAVIKSLPTRTDTTLKIHLTHLEDEEDMTDH